MPLFLSDEEFQGLSHDASLVADKADVFIREIYNQLETVKAEADAAAITAEQTCSVIEQKYVALTAELSALQSQHSELITALDKRDLEFGQLQSNKQQFLLQSVEKDGLIERLKLEGSELHKSKRQLMEILEQKDLEISEKNATIKSYLDKIVNLTEIGASKEAHQADLESELARLNATTSRLLQEKELLERHNSWLNEELTAKVDDIIQLRKENGELEADMSSKLADAVSEHKLSADYLKLHKDKVSELEEKLASMEEELLSTKKEAAAAEQHFTAEISTVTKLLDLYKESSDEWSKKAGDLEGVIKALETHLNQVEDEHKERLGKEEFTMKQMEMESDELKEKLQTFEAELERLRKENELKHPSLSGFTANSWMNLVDTGELVEDDRAIVPKIPGGVSGTALAASLLRDGWSLAKMYAKYQEAADALHHEELGRKQTQAILERVLYEIEEKARVIMDEREEHERLVEAYSALDQKLQHSLSEHSALETNIRELKASLKRQERDRAVAQKEIVQLQKQVAVLLKECRDVQLRCGYVAYDDEMITVPVQLNAESDAESILSVRLLTFKDINGLVEQNSQLRSLAHDLSQQIEKKEAELKEEYEMELQKHTADTASKVNAVLQKAEEQGQMIESLHASVAMYKKLYEEGELKLRTAYRLPTETAPELGSQKVIQLRESSLESSSKIPEQAFERVKSLEEELSKSKSDLISLRAECDKLSLEARFAKEKLARFMKEFEHQREEHNRVIARNVEFSQLIVDYQRKVRESSDSVNDSNKLCQKLTMEVSILKHEKEILQNSEKRAFDEVRSLSERVHRLQASLDTIQSTQEVREEAKTIERRKQEEYVKKIEQEWAEAKRELQQERDNARNIALERESTLNSAFRQVEELRKELASALQSVAAVELRAAVAEARCADSAKITEPSRVKDSDPVEGDPSSSASEKILANFREEIENLRGEARSSKDHMLQYKSIAQVNEAALKQMESTYENFRTEANDVRKSLEAELLSLKGQAKELENECKLKTEEAIAASARNEEALTGALFEISSLKEDCSVKMSQILLMESQFSTLKEDLEQEHQRWLSAQANYERQVILQSETIQELTKTSQALASFQDEVSELRKVADVLRNENNELKSKWETEKLALEVYKNVADSKYNEVNELNKILHSRLEALHIKSAEKERGIAFGSTSQTCTDDDGLQNVMNYLRRSKEITETEISLLKQEKLRLQSQLESVLKSSEDAQTSLRSERAKSRSALFTEEDFKSLQLQVRELTLLRESNAQLREENRHNFEECQKLREALQKDKNEIENLEKLLRSRETDLEACRKEIDMQKMEKVHLEKRINELLEKCRDVDVNDYNRLKESSQLMQSNLREKEAQIEELEKKMSEKQDSASRLEQDLAMCRTELNERDTKISELLQSEASLKSEAEKHKRLNIQGRRKFENLLKEKEDQIKEMQAQVKQLEDAKQAKRNLGDSAGEQALKEKEKEKDSRIQTLERALERHREELRKEKEDHLKEKERSQKIRKTILDSREIVEQQKIKLTDELRNHKEALKALQDEVEKLKGSGGSQSESTSVVQQFSSTILDEMSSAYFQAVENFEQVVQPACDELEPASAKDAPAPSLENNSAVGASTGQSIALVSQIPSASASNVASKTVEEKERRFGLGKVNARTARKLVRPNITKPKEPQSDVDMSEAYEINPLSSSQNAETQENVALPTAPLVRKRSSASILSDGQEMPVPEEAIPDMVAPVVKKAKGSESLQDGGEEKPASPSKLVEVVLTEESSDDVANIRQSVNEELVDAEKDEFENVEEQIEETTVDEQIQADPANEAGAGEVADEKSEKPSEAVLSPELLRDQIEQDIQQIVTEFGSDVEEGEMVADLADNDGDSYIPGSRQLPAEQSVEPENSPGMEPFIPVTFDVGEIDPPLTPEEKNDGSDVIGNIVESSDKLNDGSDTGGETDQFSGAVTTTTDSNVDPVASEQGDTGGKPVSPLNSSSTTINLQERARERGHLRQLGRNTSSSSRPHTRVVRVRGNRGGRNGRGQPRG
ncbi:LOW QUALITY PROTEIN: nuclear-pore anchor [Primulina eburnea]|uniref:LOW QUALITY PROTEIN: nuclear-pore anchor n=1 Tax=Primulina eburnea TaxID=1245227 RepID=UPI003C6C8244